MTYVYIITFITVKKHHVFFLEIILCLKTMCTYCFTVNIVFKFQDWNVFQQAIDYLMCLTKSYLLKTFFEVWVFDTNDEIQNDFIKKDTFFCFCDFNRPPSLRATFTNVFQRLYKSALCIFKKFSSFSRYCWNLWCVRVHNW